MIFSLGRQGQGSLCTNYENFDGYTFGSFACPLPASTGMNQLDQFCCGSAHYQYCCNAQFVFLNLIFSFTHISVFI